MRYYNSADFFDIERRISSIWLYMRSEYSRCLVFPKLAADRAAIWTNKYLQPFHAGYVSVDTNGSIVIRTSEAISVNDRLNANLTWTVH